MRNFKFKVSVFSDARERIYKVSRSNPSYSFFKCEYLGLPSDEDGNFLVSGRHISEEKKSTLRERLQNLRNFLFCSGDSVIVERNSDAHMFFSGEYRDRLPRDIDNNLIVPGEYIRTKIRSKN